MVFLSLFFLCLGNNFNSLFLTSLGSITKNEESNKKWGQIQMSIRSTFLTNESVKLLFILVMKIGKVVSWLFKGMTWQWHHAYYTSGRKMPPMPIKLPTPTLHKHIVWPTIKIIIYHGIRMPLTLITTNEII